MSIEDLMNVEVTTVSRKAQRLTDTAAAAFVVTAEDRTTLDIDVQNRFALTSRQDLVWGLGYRHGADSISSQSLSTILPAKQTQTLFSAFVHDEFTVVPDRWRIAAVIPADPAGGSPAFSSESVLSCELGYRGMIGLGSTGGRVTFEINNEAAQASALKISSQLLRLATSVRGRTP